MKYTAEKLDAGAVLWFLWHEMGESDFPPFLCETPCKAA